MLISYRWLQRHVDLTGISPEEVARELTTHTAEVEGLEPFAPHLANVVVGHVLECDRHPDADKLSVCKVDVGDGEPLGIVCGAPNIGAGQKVAVATVGTVLPGDFKIKKSKIRGVESRGMICSVKELELGEDHSGIWVLDADEPLDAPVGTPVSEATGLVDWIIEIENKSLTHRPDLWGHRGIAREIAAIRGLELKPLDLELPATGDGDAYPVRVESEGCFRYLGLPIHDVQNGASPTWLRHLLLAVDQRPIDLCVDLSNFVMLDLGQPNHLFDRGRLSPEGIVVRDARPGETMDTLDEVERTFVSEDMLISSGDEPVAVAGVMGGEASKVAPETSSLLLEVASFHPTTVRRTSARLGLRTDASARFEKHLDPTLPAQAAAHLVNTLRAMQPQITLPQPMGDAGAWIDPATTVELRPARVRTVLGCDVPDEDMATWLSRLGFGVDRTDAATWKVHIPSERATKDIGLEEDLIEEVGRMFGYDNVPEQVMVAEVLPPPREHRRLLVRRLADRLAGAARFHEAMTHTFQSDELLAKLGIAEQQYVRVVNPQQEGSESIRRDVLPSLLGLLELNRRQREEVCLFEVGKGYRPDEKNERGEPRELHQVALVWMRPKPGKHGRFDNGVFHALQGVLEDLLAGAGAPVDGWSRGDADAAPAWFHPGKYVTWSASGVEGTVARLGGLEPGLQRELGLTGELDGDVACAEVSIDLLVELGGQRAAYHPIPRFPGVKVDVALAVPDDLPAGDVLATIEKAGKGLAREVELFDLYRGDKLGAGEKSLAYHVLLQSPDKTLSDKEEKKFLGRLERAIGELGGELRKE